MAKKKLTPLMEQYYKIKSAHPDALLFFRMGDFYEMFGEDAKVASEILGITLTSRNKGSEDETPLAGVPYHSAEPYLARLLKAGLKVAVCEQVEDPKKAVGIVKREVIETHTPGTITEILDDEDSVNRYIVGLYPLKNRIAMVCSDISTGEFWTKEFEFENIFDEITRIEPKEILFPENIQEEYLEFTDKLPFNPLITYYPEWNFELEKATNTLLDQFKTSSLDGYGKLTDSQIRVSGAMISYLSELKKRHLKYITGISIVDDARYLVIDHNTARNLELVKTQTGDTDKGTLLRSLDFTRTPMGKRLIRNWIVRPLVNIEDIEARLSALEALLTLSSDLDKLRTILGKVGDLERLATRLGMEKANPRDLLAIADSIDKVPEIKEILDSIYSSVLIENITNNLDTLDDIKKSIFSTISPNAPANINHSGIFKSGVSTEIDELSDIIKGGDKWIRSKEEEVKSNTGITNLRIKYNKVFGYFIEVSKAQSEKVPDNFIRKQTLVNCERYITPELKEMETKVVSAHERILELERDKFIQYRHLLSKQSSRILNVAIAIAKLDVLESFAYISRRKRFTRPVFNPDAVIEIKEGRHPVVEDVLGESAFVPNDVMLDDETNQIIILTGPNMAGKSTYLRQIAIISMMAQFGCFVPAKYANLCIVDKIFCRVGASDNIVLGRSTFLTEMIEAAHILNNATPKSLVLLDEIGRGTSTYDGQALSWAITEYLHNNEKHRAKTVFATHYHMLTRLESHLSRVINYQVVVRSDNGVVKFLHNIVKGGCDDSYGIYVAKFAGVPVEVIKRAENVLHKLEKGEIPSGELKRIGLTEKKEERVDNVQFNLFEPEYHPLVVELHNLDVDSMSPREALELMYKWSEAWGKRRKKDN